MRGRLIFPFIVELSQLDTVATAADPDGAGPLVSGYDPDFREPVRISLPDAQGPGVNATVYKDPLQCRAQIEMGTYAKLREFFSGNSPDMRMSVVMHFRDLERAGLVDEHGSAGVRIGDRLDKILDRRGALVQELTTPVYVVQAEPTAFGIGRSRNLLVVYFEARVKAPEA